MRALGLVVLVIATATVAPAVPTLDPSVQPSDHPTTHERRGGPLATAQPARSDLGEASARKTRPELPPDTAAPAERANRTGGAIVAVHPDPVAPNDRGEYVVVEYPAGAGWTLSDGDTRVRLPGGAGRVVVTADPEAAVAAGAPLDSGRVVVADGLRLANGGETLVLRHGSTVADEVAYERSREADVLRPGIDEWRPVGATDFDPVETGSGTAEAFVLPDAPGVVVRTLRTADRRILLGGYTLSSWRIARALVAARERGATVRVLVDGSPVGGTSRRQARILDWLVEHDVSVAVLFGPRARYQFHHAKYAVVDERAVVLTENYKPAGTGGRSSRGWGVVVDDPGASNHLAEVFRADAGWRDAVPWAEFRANRSFESGGVANGSYPSRFQPRTVPVDRVRVLVAPDNAEGAIVETIRGAEESVLVQQVSVGGRDQPFLRATVDAARRGVRVRVLLSSAWYVRGDNRELVDELNDLARREGLPLAARLAEPRSRYEKIHAKGAVVDEETVVVGSVNWNNHSARANREVAVVLSGDEVGRYYARAFRADWRGGTRQVPTGVAIAVVLVATAGLRATRAVTFERSP